ncbi:M67 family metallopeptidase [Nitrosococcus watsonii]|uniref:Mov34/MPN/PAD-1 family protein n=1 Tax=Nitrosococcus watsoni (strain C-113) TaxID=105559 RepID=D8KAT1_NITWC|nr:M67 family metallopeptidase [Nitrosococcus watsonii]ADJ29508.1 Mov34/MPN/PAD-1 family protein [Nitrosococcus watsonii C-113]
MAAVALPRPLVNQLLHQAQAKPQQEICGLIGARNGLPFRCYPMNNIAPEPQRHFLMDPQGQIAAMRRMREEGEELFGIYHSHPETAPLPSKSDLAQAAYPGVLYLIISLNTKGVLEMRGFRLQGEVYEEIELQL